MRTKKILALLPVLLAGAAAWAAPDNWHARLEDGLAASSKSGKPVLVVTIWKEKV